MRMTNEAEGEDDENKALTAMSILRTIVTFLRTLQESEAVTLFSIISFCFLISSSSSFFLKKNPFSPNKLVGQLEEILFPLIRIVLEQSLLGFSFFFFFLSFFIPQKKKKKKMELNFILLNRFS